MNKLKPIISLDVVIHALFPFVDFLYILQLEDYNSRGYWHWIQTRLFKRGFQKVDQIKWTKKAQILLLISFLLYFIFIISISGLFANFWWLILNLIIFSSLIPHLILSANLIFSLADIPLKKRIILQAQNRLKNLKNCTVVAIIGSQGKTTTRHFLCQIIEGTKTCHNPPENNNVALSMARDILSNLNTKTEVYVVEFGELYKGDLTYLFRFLQPKIIVLTSVSSQHIAQFGSQKNIDNEFASILKIAGKSIIVANQSDDGVKRVIGQCDAKVDWYDEKVLDILPKSEWPSMLAIPHLRSNASAAYTAAMALGIDREHLRNQLTKLEPTDRRLKMTKRGDITIIDDSYNISPDSALEALRVLDKYRGRRVLVTGGIVDQGADEAHANVVFGQQIAKVADVAIVAQNILAPHVEKGLRDVKETINLIKSSHPDKTPAILQRTLKPGDTVLIQNELPDTYWS